MSGDTRVAVWLDGAVAADLAQMIDAELPLHTACACEREPRHCVRCNLERPCPNAATLDALRRAIRTAAKAAR